MSHHHHHPETWVTPEGSEFLSAKLIILHKGQSMPMHTTGPGKEEVIVCCAGSIIVRTEATTSSGNRYTDGHVMHPGNYCFIPKNTEHSVHVNPDSEGEHGIYVYVTNKEAS